MSTYKSEDRTTRISRIGEYVQISLYKFYQGDLTGHELVNIPVDEFKRMIEEEFLEVLS
jgi:hypothetical protein